MFLNVRNFLVLSNRIGKKIYSKTVKINIHKLFCNRKIDLLEKKDNFCFTKNSILNEEKKEGEISNIKDDIHMKIVISNNQINLNKFEDNIQSKIIAISFRKDFMDLTKFKLCILNTAVSLSTYAFYSTNSHMLTDFILFTLGTMCISMTSQVFNQIKEKLLDEKMRRTQNRPLPKRRMSDKTAMMIGATLWLSSIVFYSFSCPHAILFSNLIVLLYIKAYTPMKRNSNSSMHIGAIVGALPALLGSYAATGDLLLESSLLLAAYIYAWQYPHFYGILYQNKDDYKKAGFNFISNYEDKTYISYIQMLIAMTAMLYIVYKLYKSNDKIVNTFSFYAYLIFYFRNLYPVLKFYSNPMKYAKKIRKESYIPFLIVLISFAYSSYKRRITNI